MTCCARYYRGVVQIRDLEYFLACCQARSFTVAARNAHIVQSAMSSAIARLEHDLGVPLFDRSVTPVAVTEHGAALQVAAQRILDAVQAARDDVAAVSGQIRGTVILGSTLSTGALDLAAVLADVRDHHPGVVIHVRQSTAGSAGNLQALLDGTMDIALTAHAPSTTPASAALASMDSTSAALASMDPTSTGLASTSPAGISPAGAAPGSAALASMDPASTSLAGTGPAGTGPAGTSPAPASMGVPSTGAAGAAQPGRQIILHPLVSEALVFACRPDHPLGQRSELAVADLAGETILRFPPGWGVRDAVDRVLGDAPAATEIADYALMIKLIQAGFGTSLIPASALTGVPGLRAIPVADDRLSWRLSAAISATRRPSAAATTLLHTLTQHAA